MLLQILEKAFSTNQLQLKTLEHTIKPKINGI